MGGGAWPFLVGGAICLVNSDNERDSVLLTRRVNPVGRGRGVGGLGRRRPRSRQAGPVSPNAFARRQRRSSGAAAPSASRGPRARGRRPSRSGSGGVKPLGLGRGGRRPRASVSGSAVKRAASAAVAGGSRYVTRATAGSQELKLFLEGQAADENSRTRLSDNRSVMPLDVLGRTRATLKESACVNVPGPTGFRVTR